MEKQELTPETLALKTGHFPTFSMALAMAMTRCAAWRSADSGQTFTAEQLLRFAQHFDTRHKYDEKSFFMVSSEGAIGVSPGLECLTKWLFVPATFPKEQ